MKTIAIVAFVALILSSSLFLSGCSSRYGLYGQPITETNITPVGDILAHPDRFVGKTVKIEGKIIEECPSGGWFILKDKAAVIYVDLHPSYFAIPKAVGRQAAAQGVVKKDGPQTLIVGKGVEVK